MDHLIIINTRHSYGYACACFFDLVHFLLHIESAKPACADASAGRPKPPGYMRTFSYEYELKKDAAKETIMYGVIWVFLAALISGIPFLENEYNLLYNAISLFLFIVGIRKLMKGTRRLIKLKKRKIQN